MQIARAERKLCANLDNGILTVYRSVLLSPRSTHYAPVRDLLTDTCFRPIESSELTDTTMASGRAQYFAVELFSHCPGPDLWHVCLLDRIKASN